MREVKPIDVGESFSQTGSIWSDHLRLIMSMSLAFLAFDVAGILISTLGAAGIAVQFGLSLALAALFQGMVAALICLPSDEDRGMRQLFDAVSPSFGKLIWAYLLYAVAVLAGVALFIVPGLIFMTIWAVVCPVIVTSGAGVLEAFGRSRELVRGNGLRVFAVLLVVGLLAALFLLGLTAVGGTVVGGLLSVIGFSLVIKPLLAILVAVLFVQLEAASAAP